MNNFKLDVFLTNNKMREFILNTKINTTLTHHNKDVPSLILTTSTEMNLLNDINEFIDIDLVERIMIYIATQKRDNIVAIFNKQNDKLHLNLKKKINETSTEFKLFYK